MPTPASPSSGSPKLSLSIVEDDADVRSILAEWVAREEGMECRQAFACAEEALPSFAAGAPDVALIDINLPGMSGIEFVRRMKPTLPGTQFVMLTVYEDSAHIFDALSAGASGYLQKRTSRAALLTAVREVHAGGSPMTSNIARLVVESFQKPVPKETAAEGLSRRESEVLALIARGYLYKEVAESIGISLPTVKTYIRRICEKLHVRSRAQAVALYANLPLKPR